MPSQAAIPVRRPAAARSARQPDRASMADALYSLAAVFVTLLFFFPLYWTISNSLRLNLDTFAVGGLGVPFVDFSPTFQHWVGAFDPETFRALGNSTVISVSAVLLAMALGLPAAYALARFRFLRVKNKDLTIWFLSQRVLPPVAAAVPFFMFYNWFDLMDTRIGLIMVNATFILPFVVVIVRQTFQDLPVELEEAALVDGASHFGAFFRISLPLALPAVVASGLIMFAFAWNEYLFALILTTLEAQTMPVYVGGFIGTRGAAISEMAVRALIALGPPVILALIAQRYIVRGLTLGAVKG